jgi:hypothetical protein
MDAILFRIILYFLDISMTLILRYDLLTTSQFKMKMHRQLLAAIPYLRNPIVK